MDITITCQLSLSKKLRALIGNNETSINIITSQIKDGKAEAKINLSLDSIRKSDFEELFKTTPELKKSYLSKFDIVGNPIEFPYHNENEIFNVDKIIQSIINQ
jgi:hypothetical protein